MWDERLGSVADLLPVGVLLLSRDGELLEANSRGLSFLGLDQRAFAYEGFPELIENEELRRAAGAPPNGALRMILPRENKSYLAELTPVPDAEDGAKLLVLRDVTGLVDATLLRRKFVFDLLHKLRTPLTTILSVLSMASQGRLEGSTIDPAEFLDMGALQAERLASLFSRLKDLALVEMNLLGEDAEAQTVTISSVLRKVAAGFATRLERKGQRIEKDLPPENVIVRIDTDMLTRALEMVLLNAHQYSPEDSVIRLVAQADPEHVRIEVVNEGPGIGEDELPHVFERFWRGGSPHVLSVEGEGLGLYLARHLLLAQGGAIHVDSRPHEWTKVEMTLRTEEGE